MSMRRSPTSRAASRRTASRRTAKVDLEPSTIGGLVITRADVDGDYRDSTGDIRTFEIVGRDVNVQASGTLALNDTGQSNLTIHADTPSLEEIGKLFDQPISRHRRRSTGRSPATGASCRRPGHVDGNGVKYGENGALTMSSDFTARVPDLTVGGRARGRPTRRRRS